MRHVHLLLPSDNGNCADAVVSAAAAVAGLVARHLEKFDPGQAPRVEVRHTTAYQVAAAATEAARGQAYGVGPRAMATALLEPRIQRWLDADAAPLHLPRPTRGARHLVLHPAKAITVHLDVNMLNTASQAAAAAGSAAALLVLRNPDLAIACLAGRVAFNLSLHTQGLDRLIQFGPPSKVVLGDSVPVATAWSLS